MNKDLFLTSLISSRICHDLISPIGAINNGLELLALTGGDTSDEIALISESAKSASDCLRFLRIAFGSSSQTEMIRMAEVGTIANAHLTTQRLSIDWIAGDGEISRANAKIVLLMAQTGAVAAPLGGALSIETGMTRFPFRVSVHGSKVVLDRTAIAALNCAIPLAEVEPRFAPLALLGLLAEEEGQKVDWITDGSQGRLQLA